MRHIYMDANATTPLLPEVFEAMRPFWIEHFGNASSIHQQGQYARAAVDQARAAVAGFLHCRTSEVVFTSGGTESDNLALFGVLSAESSASGEKPHLITSSIEHDAVLHAAQSLSAQNIDVTFLPCTPQGLIEPAALEAAIRPNTKLVSIIFANNETGVIQPIAELARIAHAAGALFHADAVQAAGKLPLDLSPRGPLREIDLLTLSGHKIHGPKGIGVLYVRRNVRLAPMLHGGPHERQRRAGTENVAGIVGLGKAAELARQWLAEDSSANGPAHLAALRDRLEQGILSQVEECGVNGDGAPRVSNTSNLYFDHVEAEALVIALDLKGLSVSGGSACQSGATEPSHVLTSMGLSPARARASIRFSLSKLTTEEEVEQALALVPTAVARLRDLSPTYKKTEPALAG
ncbi:MAG: cysteine desulfurase NifS [Acidobacteriales bacterium 59-55]|nr:cysteine desulfurase [Terriglobales bacterium]OJV41361.1 MAG: cysteine desulfurase NifS [Acidobacteriales bacterium 59-55]